MHEPSSKFLNRVIEGRTGESEERKSFSAERQQAAQSFNLHVEHKDGRRSEGFAWSHYTGYRWTDEGSLERLVLLFGARAVEIEGQNLGPLVGEIRQGQLNGIRELAGAQALMLAQNNADDQPIIQAIREYPDFDEIFKTIKGEEKGETRHARSTDR